MDTHHSSNPQPHTEAAPPVGPRQAAARSRKKRTLILASATGLTLMAGGTATAALLTNGTGPEALTNTAQIPDAEPEELVADDAVPQGDAEQAQEATENSVQSASVEGTDVVEEEEQTEEEPEDSEPTGEGGTCEASFYGTDFAGSTTANGETFDPNGMTAAHKTLPFDTMVEVTNPSNGQSVTVRINDRGPYIAGRCLDLSTAAFDQIIGTGSGVGQVEWHVVS